jgi:hypothetical protein
MNKLIGIVFTFGLIICALNFVAAQTPGQARESVKLPVFTGASLPLPPRQKSVLEELPQTTLPKPFVTATSKLFEQGLADPRGCEYSEVEIVVGNVWGGGSVVRTHAWVLPPQKGESAQRFAVAWNGLVYPLVSLGQRANLGQDVIALIRADEEARAKWAKDFPNQRFYRFRNAVSEAGSVSHASLLPVKASLLLRLGETSLAEQTWAAWTAGMDAGVNDDARHLRDPYLMLAADWIWARFDRAVCAHMRGDDYLALLDARALDSIRPDVEAEIEKRNPLYLPAFQSGSGEKTEYLAFLNPLPELLADQERRSKESRKRQSLQDILSKHKNKPELINALILELDEAAARQWGQPGGVDDALVRELNNQGEAAVEPLLKVLEQDTRLTRSVRFHRNFFKHRHLISVGETAYRALTNILRTDSFIAIGENVNIESVEERRKLAGRIRAYLEKYGKGSTEERWYASLADDGASREAWRQAAANIVYATAYPGVPPAWVFASAPVPSRRSAEGITLRGETLRGKTAPSVSQLFVRRMFELSKREDPPPRAGEGSPYQSLFVATDLAMALLAWDGQAHLSEVRSFQELLKNRYTAADAKAPYDRTYLRGMIISLYLKRFEVNDYPTAFNEYAEWISTIKSKEAEEDTTFLFTPMKRFSDHRPLMDLAARLFDAKGSRWLPLIDKEDRHSFYRAKLIGTAMLNFKSFRDRVLEGLADKSVVGTLRPRRVGDINRYDLVVENTYTAVLTGSNNSVSAYFEIPPDDLRASQSLEPMNIRACDVYASQLVRLKDAPPFKIYWTEAERDKAVAQFAALLREHKTYFASSSDIY